MDNFFPIIVVTVSDAREKIAGRACLDVVVPVVDIAAKFVQWGDEGG